MKTNDAKNNHWMEGEAGSILRICDVLVELDRRNLIPSDLRTALVHHAQALLDVLPNYIAANANLMATAHMEKLYGHDEDKAAQVCWGMAFMSDALNGLQYVARLEYEREKYPDIHTAVSKAYAVDDAMELTKAIVRKANR